MERNVISEKARDCDSLFFVRALPSEYLVEIGKERVSAVLGGKRFRLFRKFLKIPASVQVVRFSVNNHSKNYQGLLIEGYACWRINPERAEQAVNTLDFYDASDPMQKTADNLQAICTEAIRHIVTNMDIEEALKNKERIASELKTHLLSIEQRWGITFDQVGIEHIKILSDKVFNDLQAKERDKLRLDASLSRFETDEKIQKASAEFEKTTQKTKLDTQKAQKLLEFEHEKDVREKESELKARTHEIEHKMALDKLAREQEEIAGQKQVALELLEKEKAALECKMLQEDKRLDVLRREREIANMVTLEVAVVDFLDKLPECLAALDIEQFNVDLSSDTIESVFRKAAALLKSE